MHQRSRLVLRLLDLWNRSNCSIGRNLIGSKWAVTLACVSSPMNSTGVECGQSKSNGKNDLKVGFFCRSSQILPFILISDGF